MPTSSRATTLRRTCSSTQVSPAPASRFRTARPPRSTATVGIRPTFGPLALDFGGIVYWYPGGSCFNGSVNPVFGVDCLENGFLPINGNVIKKDLTFWEAYARGTYTVNDSVAFSGQVAYSPSVLNSGAKGTYAAGGAKFTAPSAAMPEGWGLYLSGEAGHWFLGTSDAFYGVAGFPNGIPYKSYTTWNVGVGITKSVFTLDFRYYDTDMNKGDCNAFTSDQNARFTERRHPDQPGWVRLELVRLVLRRRRQVRPDGDVQSEISRHRHDQRAAAPCGPPPFSFGKRRYSAGASPASRIR